MSRDNKPREPRQPRSQLSSVYRNLRLRLIFLPCVEAPVSMYVFVCVCVCRDFSRSDDTTIKYNYRSPKLHQINERFPACTWNYALECFTIRAPSASRVPVATWANGVRTMLDARIDVSSHDKLAANGWSNLTTELTSFSHTCHEKIQKSATRYS